MSQGQSKKRTPSVVSDARFGAARTLVASSPDKAIDVFATLLDHAISKFGPDDVETSILYYEYGNAILRTHMRETSSQEGRDEDDGALPPNANESDTNKVAPRAPSSSASLDRWTALAEAAEKGLTANRSKKVKPGSETIEGGDAPEEKKPPSSDDSIAAAATAASAVEASGTSDNDTEDETEKENDAELALEMMATCYGILDQYSDSARTGDSPDSPDADFGGWVEEQLPRVLTGIGDALSHLKRHADAADAYLQALALRLAALDRLDVKGLDSVLSESMSTGAPLPPHRQSELIDLLICRRKVVESNVLVAEELLAHLEEEGVGRDVVTSETKAVLVPAGEQADYARGYYESSREQLQEAVMLVGPLKAKLPHNDTLEEERENVCFAATLVMGVGEALAALDEKAGAQQPASKRLKT